MNFLVSVAYLMFCYLHGGTPPTNRSTSSQLTRNVSKNMLISRQKDSFKLAISNRRNECKAPK